MMRGSRLDELMTLIFMILAIAAIVCYFAISNRVIFLGCASAAVIIRIAQYAIRHFK